MGTSGRYGKYGETKRLARLRKTVPGFLPAGRGIMPSRALEQFGERPFSRTKIKIVPAGIMDPRYIRSLSKRVFGIYGPYDDTLTNWFLTGMTFTIMALAGRKNVCFAMLGRSYLGQSATSVYEQLEIAEEPEINRRGVG
jgi:hypothetical protein